MKVPCGEGVASHIGPESCGCVREDTLEALTGVRAGWVLSPEIDASGAPTRFRTTEGDAARIASARSERAPRDRRPHARTQALHAEAGRPRVRLRPGGVRGANPKGARR